MSLRLILAVSIATFGISISAYASDDDVVDATTDVEELSADSDAAVRLAKEAKIRAVKERRETLRSLKEADRTRQRVAIKKDEASADLKISDAEIQVQLEEQARIKKQMTKYNAEIAAAEKAIADAKARVEKSRGETSALVDLKNEKQAKLAELLKQREQAEAERKTSEAERAQAKAEFDKVHAQEKQTLSTPKPQLARVVNSVGTATPVEDVTVVPEAPVSQPAIDTPSASEVAGVLTFKIDCNVRSGPSRTADVLTIQTAGSAISGASPNQGWITYPYSEGKVGYVAKTCFQ